MINIENMHDPRLHLTRGERVVLVGKAESETGAIFSKVVLALLLGAVLICLPVVPIYSSMFFSRIIGYGMFFQMPLSWIHGTIIGVAIDVILLFGLSRIGYFHGFNETDAGFNETDADLFVVTDMRIFKITAGNAEDVAPRADLELMQINGRTALLKIRDRKPLRIIVDSGQKQ
ncbi:MAG TPA: hypothetical protein V6C86_16390 [Oculatellaceae cyanobacterium]